MKIRAIIVAITIIVVSVFVIQISSITQSDSMTAIKFDGHLESCPAINFDKENNIYLMLDGEFLKYNQTGILIYKKTLDSKGLDPSFNLDRSSENPIGFSP